VKTIGYIAATAVVLFYATVFNGWALSLLWSWFIVTTFGLPPLSVPAAIGIATLFSHLAFRVGDENKEESYVTALARVAITATVKPLLTLGLGSVVKLWL